MSPMLQGFERENEFSAKAHSGELHQIMMINVFNRCLNNKKKKG